MVYVLFEIEGWETWFLQLISVVADKFLVITFTLFPSLWKNIDGFVFVYVVVRLLPPLKIFQKLVLFFFTFFLWEWWGRGGVKRITNNKKSKILDFTLLLHNNK